MPVPTEGKLHHLLLGTDITMTPQDFKEWRSAMRLTLDGAAEALGLSKGTIFNYERGERREDGRPIVIPKTVALACAAVRAGIQPEGQS